MTKMLTQEELGRRLLQPEGELLERKESPKDTNAIKKTLVAFANSVPEGNYAVLFIGIKDDGTVVGISGMTSANDFDTLQRSIRKIPQEQCYPPFDPQISLLPHEGKSVIAVVVQHSKNRPHFAGPAYVRRGSESIIASEKVFDDLIGSRNDKARRILAQGMNLITIQWPTLDREQFGFIGHRPSESRDFRICDCDAHRLRYFEIDSGTHHAAPLDNVKISYDEKKHRFKLIIEGVN